MVGTSRNPKRRTMKRSSWENFQPGRDGIGSLGKNDKKERKLNLKRWGVEALKEERLEVSFLGTPQNGKSARGFWGKSTKRRKLWEIRKGLATKVASTTLALVPRGAKEGNQWYPGTLGWHYKKGKHPTVKGHSTTMNQNRIIEKTPSKSSKKVVKEREISPGILKQPL